MIAKRITAKVYRAYQRAEERLRDQGGRVRRVVLDYELKRDYQRLLHERNRGKKDCDGRPDREPEEIERWALTPRRRGSTKPRPILGVDLAREIRQARTRRTGMAPTTSCST